MDTTNRAAEHSTARASDPLSPVCAEGDAGFAERYRAISSRDVRFDGQFVTGVTSTGIYCRPSCPALTPKPGNVVFLLTSAAAHESGFRACRRCLPEAVPGTPAWNLRGDIAARAMRLISDGVVDREGVPGLAKQLGFTPRHLSRLLAAELGAGPLALARAHRAQTARTLATATDLPLADIAFAAGFGSVRQFNDTIRDVFASTPGDLRARRRRSRGAASSQATALRPAAPQPAAPQLPASQPATRPQYPAPPHGHTRPDAPDDWSGSAVHLSVDLPVRHPFDAPGTFGFLAVRAIAGVEAADLTNPTHLRYARTLALPHGPAAAEVVAVAESTATAPSPSPAAPSQAPTIWSVRAHLAVTSLADVPTAISRLRRMLDLDADPTAADTVLSEDPLLAHLVAAVPGVRVPGAVDPHELAIRAVVGQQISVAAARTHLGRLASHAGSPVDTAVPGLTTLFPTPAQISQSVTPVPAGSPLEPDRPLRLPRRSLATIHALATALSDGTLSLHVGMDAGEMRTALQDRPGIGPWTAAYITMRVLGDPDAWLPGDAALAAAGRRLGFEGDLDADSARWSPWRSYAVVRLWRTNADAADPTSLPPNPLPPTSLPPSPLPPTPLRPNPAGQDTP